MSDTKAKQTTEKDTLTKVRRWWDQLTLGERAELRRCRSPEAVRRLPQFYELRRQLPEERWGWKGEILPVLVGLSAHIPKQDEPSESVKQVSQALPRQLGERKKGGDTPTMNTVRFRRLLAEDDLALLYPQLIRCLRLLGGRVPLDGLWLSLPYWNPRTKRDWAEAYYDQPRTTEGK